MRPLTAAFGLTLMLLIAPLFGEPMIIPEIRGVHLVGSPDCVLTSAAGMEGVSVHEVRVPGGLCALSDTLYPIFRDQPLTESKIQEIKRAISDYWRCEGYPFICCFVPAQDITDGILQLVVIESRVGAVDCCERRWFPKWQTVGKLHIRPGCPLNIEQISRDLSWINENPFHYTTMVVRPGLKPFTTDVSVQTCERFPLRGWVGADNTGTTFTGRARYFIGATWGNALCRGHLASYQYMTDSTAKRFQGHFGSYTIPLYTRHYLRFYGGWAQVKPNLPNGRMTGQSSQASVRYDWRNSCSTECSRSGFVVGFDWKNTDNNVDYIEANNALETPVVTDPVNISQFAVGYYLYKGFRSGLLVSDCCSRIDLKIDGYWQPGQLMSDQSAERYNQLSPGAKPSYAYVRCELNLKVPAPCCWSVEARMACQAATAHLLPSEQFGLGGIHTVRGYVEREFNADNALLLSAELHTCPISPICRQTCKDELTFLAFIDYGFGNNNVKAPTEEPITYLLGAGPGVRYRFWTYLYAQADWGIRIVKNQFNQPKDGGSRFYFSVVATY